MIPILVAAFVLSGAAGLIYESIWSRYLGLFVGHSAYAQIIVLVIFLGGMSLGAHLAGKRSHRVRSPLLWYAAVEIIVGVLALVFHDAFTWATAAAYDSLFPSLSGATLTIVKWGIASALILPQSVLLGTTFPLMSAGVIRVADAARAPGRILGLLYFANSLGAAVGVVFAGFFLIEAVGLPGTVLIAAFMNMVAAIVVGLLARAHDRRVADEASRLAAPGATDAADASVPTARPAAPADPPVARGPLWRPLLIVAFGTAVASFVYEIAWIRMLSLVLGSATHAFELMLSAFILGLALGALWIRTRADTVRDPVRFLGYVQWAMGILAVATLPFYLMSFDWMAAIIQSLQRNENGYRIFQVTRYLLALLVMLPATFCAGMTLPLITKVLMRAGAGERAIGAVYAINTLGSIAGVILAGLLLMPVLGLKLLLVFGAVIDIALGVWLIAISRRERPDPDERPRSTARLHSSSLAVPIAVTAAAVAGIAFAAQFDLTRLTSGVYRHGILARPGEYSFLFYEDGRTASVSMRRGGDGFVTLATNGKPDASMEKAWMDTAGVVAGQRTLTRDIATQLLLPLVTLAHAPDAKDMAVIGHGSGMSSHVLLGSTRATEVVTIEIEPEMVEASKFFRPANRRVFDDPRSTFVIDDAKSYFASSGRKFDLILSEPSNPWVSGVSGLFTVEFYERVRHQLAPMGVFGQWLHLYELSDGLVTSVLAALDSVFPAYDVYFTSNADILVVAANDRLSDPDWNVTRYPGIAEDLRRAVPLSPELFRALRLGGRAELRPLLLARGAPNSDFFPVLDLGAERMRYLHEAATGYMSLQEGRFDVVAALSNRRAPFATQTIPATPEIARPVALSLGARIRAMHTLPPLVAAQLPRDPELRTALYRLDLLDRVAATNAPPADWHAWVTSVANADEELHGGTAGVVDTAFYAKLKSYAARTGAPAEARSALDFLEAIGGWNWPMAAVSARALMSSTDTVSWLPDVLVRNAGTVAFIKVGDLEGAKEVLRHFAKRTNEDSFRDRLLGSYLVYADTTLRKRMGWR